MGIKNLAVGIAAMAISLATVSATAQTSRGDGLIVPGVRIGAAVLEQADQGALVRDLGEPDQTVQRGDRAWYRFGAAKADESPPDDLVVVYDLAKDAPFEIVTASPLYHMRSGLGVGSTAAAVRSALGAPLCEGGNGDAGIIVYDKIWFAISQGAVARISVREHLTAADFQTGPVHC
jgi:hypothetical protein